MSVNKTWNGVTYSIPNTRSESGWETTLSTYLQALADNAATTTFNKQAVRKATTTPVTVSASTDCTIIVDLTGPGASTVNLPAGADKQIFVIVDGKGDASTNNITIDANGSETIEGSLTKVIRLNRECLVLQYSSSAGDWKVVGGYVPNMVGGPASSTDNAIARFDGTTGKLVQNSDCTISDTGAVSFPTSTTHIFGANSAGNTVVSARTATGDHAVFETRRNNAITTAFGIDDSGSYTNATVGSSAFLGTNGETLHFVTGAGFAGSAGNITTGGAWTLGPPSAIGTSTFAGSSIVGKTNGAAIAVGYVGQVLETTYTVDTAFNTTGTWGQDASLTLTPGVWLLFGTLTGKLNGATVQSIQADISTTNGGSSGLPDNYAEALPPNSFTNIQITIAGVYANVSSNTTYYLNRRAFYTSGPTNIPRHTGRLRAVRIA